MGNAWVGSILSDSYLLIMSGPSRFLWRHTGGDASWGRVVLTSQQHLPSVETIVICHQDTAHTVRLAVAVEINLDALHRRILSERSGQHAPMLFMEQARSHA